LLSSPLYRFDAWLRDESSYSRWEQLRLVDLSTGQVVPIDSDLPADFRLDVVLRRPEAAARVWLLGQGTDRREGLELDRDRRNARWLVQRDVGTDALPRWFFPEQPAPFAAELLQLLGRSVAAGYALALAAVTLAWLAPRVPVFQRVRRISLHPLTDVVLAGWLVAAALVTTRLYHQLPHILDSVSYTFQAGLFASGQLSLAAPPLPDAFKGPFEVLWQGRIFSQYPPGAPAAYALGSLVGLEWLVGPVACLVLIGATAWSARTLFGTACGLAVLVLGVLSPFVLFQAGSFLSHPIAGALLAAALAAFVAADRGRSTHWYAVSGALLGAAFVTREAASVLFALPLATRLLTTRRWQAVVRISAFGLPFVLAYLLYNVRETGSAFLLPRTLFDPSDHFGFGDGVGFHTRHTLAAGLANTDELLTVLQFDAFGWPPLFAFGLIGVRFLFGRVRSWDLLAAGGWLAFVVACAAYFYHGIALGPRYYFEAMPWLLLLAGRGVQMLITLGGSRGAGALIVGVLSLNTLLFYTPTELQRRMDLSGLPGGSRVSLSFVESTLLGPRLRGLPDRALVVTDDWWLYNTALAALNCPHVPDCSVLFALARSPEDTLRLRGEFPDRTLLRTFNAGGRIELVPG
jgi:hypothetical protein